jgi:hypothetical protein
MTRGERPRQLGHRSRHAVARSAEAGTAKSRSIGPARCALRMSCTCFDIGAVVGRSRQPPIQEPGRVVPVRLTDRVAGPRGEWFYIVHERVHPGRCGGPQWQFNGETWVEDRYARHNRGVSDVGLTAGNVFSMTPSRLVPAWLPAVVDTATDGSPGTAGSQVSPTSAVSTRLTAARGNALRRVEFFELKSEHQGTTAGSRFCVRGLRCSRFESLRPGCGKGGDLHEIVGEDRVSAPDAGGGQAMMRPSQPVRRDSRGMGSRARRAELGRRPAVRARGSRAGTLPSWPPSSTRSTEACRRR